MDHERLELRQVIRRQLHHKVAGLTHEQGAAKNQAIDDCKENARKVEGKHHRPGLRSEECSRKQRIHRKASAAAHERHKENREETFTLGFEHARTHNARHAATKADHHRHKRTTRQTEESHKAVRDKRRTRHVARVFQERKAKEHEENDRDERRNRLDTGTHTVCQNCGHKARRMQHIREHVAKAIHENGTKQHVKEINERATDCHGNPEHQIHRQEENRERSPAIQEHRIDLVRPSSLCTARKNRLACDFVSHAVARIRHCKFAFFAKNGSHFGLINLNLCFCKLICIALFVAQVHEGNPTGIRIQKLCNGLHLRLQIINSLFDILAIINRLGLHLLARDNMRHLADEIRDAPFIHSRKRNHRHAETFRKNIQVQMQAALFRNVDHVCRNHHRDLHIDKLRGQEQIAFDVRGINDINNKVGFASEQIIDSGAFVFRIRKERICTRQIHNADMLVTNFKKAFLLFDSHARPVTNTLASARKSIK